MQSIQPCGILDLYSPLPGEMTAAKIGLKVKKTTKGKLFRLALLEQNFMVAGSGTVCANYSWLKCDEMYRPKSLFEQVTRFYFENKVNERKNEHPMIVTHN